MKGTTMSKYDSTNDTKEHITKVQENMEMFLMLLKFRAEIHDASKLKSPEKEIFDTVTPRLQKLTYGSEEYKASLAEMKPALEHHYANNPHHPEYHSNGINGMNLIDLVEMLCDWKAATERHDDGDISKSLEINQSRFQISDQLQSILQNTVVALGWKS